PAFLWAHSKAYLLFSIMYLTDALISSSEQSMHMPRGRMARIPSIACSTSVASPCAIRGAQAATSPVFGAPAAPGAWDAMQAALYTAPPERGLEATAAAAVPHSSPSTQTEPTGLIRSSTARSLKMERSPSGYGEISLLFWASALPATKTRDATSIRDSFFTVDTSMAIAPCRRERR